jgi:acyl carrier protein
VSNSNPFVFMPMAGSAILDEQTIYAELTTIFRDVFDDDTIDLLPEMTADDIPEWDSMSHVRLVLTIERHFHKKFPASRISQLKDVGDLVSLIKSTN